MNKGPTVEELRQQALDRAKQAMFKENGVIMGKIKRLTCLVSLTFGTEDIIINMKIKYVLNN